MRSPVIPAARDFVTAAEASGIPPGDYNGRHRTNPNGVASLFQTTTRRGMRASTYHAFLEGPAEERPNLTIIAGAHVTRILFNDEAGGLVASGIEYRTNDGATKSVEAAKEVILSAGAVGSPQILMLSGVGPRRELEAADVVCQHELPAVGKHLKDHLLCAMHFDAPAIGLPVVEVGISAGPDALRAPAGPLPADPAEDANLPPELAALKAEAERRLAEWAETGESLVSSSLYDSVAFFSTGLGDPHSHDAQIGFIPTGCDASLFGKRLTIQLDRYFADPEASLAPDREAVVAVPNPVLPKSEGEIVLRSADPLDKPDIRMNYFGDPYDLKVMVAVMRRILEIMENWPGPQKIGQVNIPPELAAKHGYVPGEPPSDALWRCTSPPPSTTSAAPAASAMSLIPR